MAAKCFSRSIIALLLCGAASISFAQQDFANWTSNTTFDLGANSATVTTANEVNATNLLLDTPIVIDGATNYPDIWYTPTPAVGTVWSLGGIDNIAAGATGSIDVTITFTDSVFNPRLHFVNLDNATVDFAGLAVNRLSGNSEFEVTGTVVNSTPNVALLGGCDDAAGANPNGACGTVELSGGHSSITFTVTDTDTVVGSGDGFGWTMSLNAPLPQALPVPALSSQGLIVLMLMLVSAAVISLRRQPL